MSCLEKKNVEKLIKLKTNKKFKTCTDTIKKI